jgi:hypothetical protein
MKNHLFFILMSIVILSIFSISQVYAQSPTSNNNTLKTCIDVYMKKFDQGLANLDPKFKKDKDKLTVNNSTFLKNISTDACVTSYTQTGMFGHLLSAEEQEKFVTASFVKLMLEEKNKQIKKN